MLCDCFALFNKGNYKSYLFVNIKKFEIVSIVGWILWMKFTAVTPRTETL